MTCHRLSWAAAFKFVQAHIGLRCKWIGCWPVTGVCGDQKFESTFKMDILAHDFINVIEDRLTMDRNDEGNAAMALTL